MTWNKILSDVIKLSRKWLKHFLETAEKVLCQGGHIAFEWPKGTKGWQLPWPQESKWFKVADPDFQVVSEVPSLQENHKTTMSHTQLVLDLVCCTHVTRHLPMTLRPCEQTWCWDHLQMPRFVRACLGRWKNAKESKNWMIFSIFWDLKL